MNRRHARIAAAGLLVATVLWSRTAAADSSFVSVVGGSGTIHLMPGSESSIDFVVHNESDDPATLSVRAGDVADDDNGCVVPERQDADVTCGEGGGELSRWVELRLLTLGTSGPHEVWSGSVQDLETATDVLQHVAGADSPRVRLVVSLPQETANDTMSDRVSFTLHWTYTGDLVESQTSVLGVQQGTGGDNGSASLPATGSAISVAFVGIIVALLTIGTALTGKGRRLGRTPRRT